ncbi:efflux RND transporter periplasmic adaptor subunit, partial [Thiohalomonas denitrificans]|uniref:efflux RND transporter periplasmic adaptor subunit n=1 Tax=Thiohalomonas denitrificans TaxID=415747 RepID=UPI0026F169DD
RAALDVARAERRAAGRQLNRLQGLEAGVQISPAQIDEAEARMATARARVAEAEAALEERQITSPFAGSVGLRRVSPGALIEPGAVITTLATTGALKVQFELPSELLMQLKPGLPIEVDAGLERRIAGSVAHIDNIIDPATRSVAVEGVLETSGEWLKPGAFVGVKTVVDSRADAVLIPEEAVIFEGGESYVYVVGSELQVERRSVRIGVRQPGEAEILEGLEPGTRLVVRGVQTVQSGQRVQLAGDEQGGPPPKVQ